MRHHRNLTLPILASVTLLASLIVVGGPGFLTPPAGASTYDCYDNGYTGGYVWQGYSTTNYTNQGVAGDVNYQSGDMSVDSDSTQHALMYLGGNSQTDLHDASGLGYDWLQVGWALGKVANYPPLSGTEAYAERNDPWMYQFDYYKPADRPWGNRWFEAEYENNTRSYLGNTYGEWLGTYSFNFDVLDYSWLIDPTYVQEVALVEGEALSSSYKNCPVVSTALFGTNGNQSNPGYSSSTELEIETNSPTEPWIVWDDSQIATEDASTRNNGFTGSYVLTPYVSGQPQQAFKVAGGS